MKKQKREIAACEDETQKQGDCILDHCCLDYLQDSGYYLAGRESGVALAGAIKRELLTTEFG